MAWKTLGESLEAALASMMNEVGEGSGGTLPDAGKDAGTCQAPASQNREIKQETEPKGSANRALMSTTLPMGRCMTVATASPKAVGSPSPVAVIHLRIVVDNGDRPGRREETAPGRSIAQARGGNLASNLVVVGGRDHCAALSITGVSIRSRNS